MILTAAEIAHPDYTVQTYHDYLLLLALLIIEGLLTMNSTKFIGQLNKFGTVFNFIVVFIFVIWVPVGSINMPKTNTNSEVWTSKGIVNGTEWPTGFAFLMGFLSVIVSRTSLPKHVVIGKSTDPPPSGQCQDMMLHSTFRKSVQTPTLPAQGLL